MVIRFVIVNDCDGRLALPIDSQNIDVIERGIIDLVRGKVAIKIDGREEVSDVISIIEFYTGFVRAATSALLKGRKSPILAHWEPLAYFHPTSNGLIAAFHGTLQTNDPKEHLGLEDIRNMIGHIEATIFRYIDCVSDDIRTAYDHYSSGLVFELVDILQSNEKSN